MSAKPRAARYEKWRLRATVAWTIVGAALVFLLAVRGLAVIGQAVELLLVGTIVGYVCSPLTNRLEDRKVPRGAAALISLVVVVAAIVAVVALFMGPFLRELVTLLRNVPSYFTQAQGRARDVLGHLRLRERRQRAERRELLRERPRRRRLEPRLRPRAPALHGPGHEPHRHRRPLRDDLPRTDPRVLVRPRLPQDHARVRRDRRSRVRRRARAQPRRPLPLRGRLHARYPHHLAGQRPHGRGGARPHRPPLRRPARHRHVRPTLHPPWWAPCSPRSPRFFSASS